MNELPSTSHSHKLGEVAASEQLIRDLYLDLRRRTRLWANVTKQTAQARMGYIGQHLVSVATGRPGGKSGARGRDLVHADGTSGEIKTCYRVDQLGKCKVCGEGASPDDAECAECGSAEIIRKEDSKWLISFSNEKDFSELLIPTTYYLVLFDFTDLQRPDTIRASIWTVDPRHPGFVLCLVDYYNNIRAKSSSGAPFNLWPYSLKFELMSPSLIYQSLIKADDTIETKLFPGRDAPFLHPMSPLPNHARSKVPDVVWRSVASRLGGVSATANKKALLSTLEFHRSRPQNAQVDFARMIAQEYYGPEVRRQFNSLPTALRPAVEAALL